MVGARVNLQLGEHLGRQLVLGKHPADGFLDDPFRLLGQTVFGGLDPTAGVAGEPVVFLLLPLFAAESDLFGVNHDDRVAGEHVGRVGGTVLAHQNHGDVAGQPADDLVAAVDDVPVLFQLANFRQKRFRTNHFSYLPPLGRKKRFQGPSRK